MSGARFPDFVVIGAMKAGTTTLYEHLAAHRAAIFMSELKELDFFVAEKNWRRGLDWYAAQFADAPSSAIKGEASPNYSKAATFAGVPERMHANVPDAKLIYILRDPVARMKSQYAHSYLSGRDRRKPEEALTGSSGNVDTSLYGAQLKLFRKFYPDDQILVVLTEDMRDDVMSFLARIYTFLGVPPDVSGSERRANETAGRAGYGRVAGLIRRQQGVLDVARRVLPDSAYGFVKKRVSREVGEDELRVPDSAIAPLYSRLAADRELLVSQCDVDVSKWAAIPGHHK